MNASATVFTEDIYKRYVNPGITEKQKMRLLYLATIFFGLAGMTAGIAMIGVKSILDVWWQLSGIFGGGMLGLFLLGIISRKSGNLEAFAAVVIGIFVILWMSLSYLIPENYAFLRNPLHANMVIVVGTLSIFLVGTLITRFRRSRATDQ